MKRIAIPLLAVCGVWAQDIRLTQIAAGFSQPTDIQNGGDGSNRLFVVQQRGIISLVKSGQTLSQTFLDLRFKTRANGECGLLGLAFPPDFKRKQYFYVNYTTMLCDRSIVARYRVRPGAPDVADEASEEIILTQMQPYQNHNGGQLAFGPDGYLYVGFGDGGSGGDPQGNGQNPKNWLGKILRIDVESDPKYKVPPTNPFASNLAYSPEIWAMGLRNPWRFSFDSERGDLWIGDVGQDRAEEIDFQPANSKGGLNFGWSKFEGFGCFKPPCDATQFTPPVLEYATRSAGDVSVTGGYVYRGNRWPALRGTYIYGDYGSGRIWGITPETGRYSNRLLLVSRMAVSTFGRDEAGELYVADYRSGIIYRIDGMDGPRLSAGTPVVNGASFVPGLVPGSLATLFGSGLRDAPGSTSAPSVPLPSVLGGVRVTVNGRDVPLYAVAAGGGTQQVNFQAPWDLTGQTASVSVTRDGVTSPAVDVPVLSAQPGVFAINGSDAILVRASDNTLATSIQAGDVLYLYATGLGAVSNAPQPGQGGPSDPLARAQEQVTLAIGGVACEVLFAGLAPDLVGVYQVNFRVGAVSAGARDLILGAGNARSQAVRVTVQ